MVGNKTLEEKIYDMIKEFKHTHADKFEKAIYIKYEKRIIELDVSIFSASTPNILLKIHI